MRKSILIPGFCIALLGVAALAGLIVFGTTMPPLPMESIHRAVVQQDYGGLPERQFLTARDGTRLAYRAYPGAADQVAILVHGSTGQAENMHPLARTLASAPNAPSIYAVDMRGHGQSGTRGDISYVGQLEDDLADFLAARQARHVQARWTLVGFSAGGGFALRIAGSPVGARFSRFMLLAPTLHHAAPVNQPQYGGWATPYVPRIIGLTILDRMGLPWFQHLPVLTFARRDPDGALYTYSYRLWRNFAAHGDYAEDFRRAPAPPAVLVGSADELFIADAYTPLIASIRPDSKVLVLPELTHMDMTYHPDAWRAVAALLRE